MTRRVCSGGLTALGVVWLTTHLVAQAPWTTLTAEGFELRGQLSAGVLDAVACDLETAVAAVPRLKAGKTRPQVVAVDSARGIREWLPQFNGSKRANPLGAYWQGLYGEHIVIRVDASPAERLRRVLHEYAHFVTHLSQPEPEPWLDEGVSEVWEHAAITANSVEIGGPAAEHLKILRSGKNWMPVHQLVATTTIPTRNDSASEVFYAESWALVHYLMFQEHRGQGLLDHLPGRPDIPTDAALKTYVRGTLGASVTISSATAPDCADKATARRLSTLESLVDRAKALADGERPETALPLLQAALLLDRDRAEITETIGFVYFRQNRLVEAATVFDRLIAAGTGSYISYYYRTVLAEAVPERVGDGGRIPQVDYLRKALALNPGFGPAVQRLSELTRGKGYLALEPRL